MALITCEECGKEVSEMARACPNCGAPISKEAELTGPMVPKGHDSGEPHPTYAAGQELGSGCFTLFTSRLMAYVAFLIAWLVGCTYLGNDLGYLEPGVTPPLWFGFVVFVLPCILLFAFRKPIANIFRIIMGSGFLIVLAIVAFLVLLMGVSSIHGLFFDWSSAR